MINKTKIYNKKKKSKLNIFIRKSRRVYFAWKFQNKSNALSFIKNWFQKEKKKNTESFSQFKFM